MLCPVCGKVHTKMHTAVNCLLNSFNGGCIYCSGFGEMAADYLKKAGFRTTNILQTLIPGELPETILEGFGRGAFIVIKGMKK